MSEDFLCHHPKDDVTKVTHHDGHAYCSSKCYFDCINRKKDAMHNADGKDNKAEHAHHHKEEHVHTGKKVDYNHHDHGNVVEDHRYAPSNDNGKDITHQKFSQTKSF